MLPDTGHRLASPAAQCRSQCAAQGAGPQATGRTERNRLRTRHRRLALGPPRAGKSPAPGARALARSAAKGLAQLDQEMLREKSCASTELRFRVEIIASSGVEHCDQHSLSHSLYPLAGNVPRRNGGRQMWVGHGSARGNLAVSEVKLKLRK